MVSHYPYTSILTWPLYHSVDQVLHKISQIVFSTCQCYLLSWGVVDFTLIKGLSVHVILCMWWSRTTHTWLFIRYTRFTCPSMVNPIKMLSQEMVNRWEAYSSHMYLKRMHCLHVMDFEPISIDFLFKSLV